MLVSTYATILQVCLIREKSGNMFVKWVERLSEIYTIHVTMPFITISIALIEYLYFYYRWHVS
jgi:hypothetical protein